MSSTAALVELGDRYAALGLATAARAAFERALGSAETDDPVPARRLAELALAAGDAEGARGFAQAAASRRGGAAARLLLGRAQLAAGELAAARFSFAQVLEAAASGPLLRVRALIGRTQVALAEGDQAGALATCLAAIDGLIGFAEAPGRRPEEVEAELPLYDEAVIMAVATGCGDELERRIDERLAAGSPAPCHLVRALVRAHRQAQGEIPPDDAAIERELEQALTERPGSRAIRLRLGERRLRRRRGATADDAARQRALADLEALAGDMSGEPAGPVESVELARIYFLLGSAYADDPAQLERSEKAYREGLRRRPGHAGAANQLALVALARGDLGVGARGHRAGPAHRRRPRPVLAQRGARAGGVEPGRGAARPRRSHPRRRVAGGRQRGRTGGAAPRHRHGRGGARRRAGRHPHPRPPAQEPARHRGGARAQRPQAGRVRRERDRRG